jgi:hypothetical protein
MKTIKELSKNLNVSKETIRKHFHAVTAKQNRQVGGKLVVDEKTETLIRERVSKKTANKNRQLVANEEVLFLRKQNENLLMLIASLQAENRLLLDSKKKAKKSFFNFFRKN